MGKAIRITVEGEWSEIDMPEGDTLHWLYEQIGCSCVDLVRVGPNLDMWVDDMGSYVNDGQNVNWLATALNQLAGNLHPALWGTAILASSNQMGDTTALSDDDVYLLRVSLRHLKIKLVDAGLLEVKAS